MLQGFADKDMIEQITLLDELVESGQAEAVPALLELYATPMADQAVDEMVYHTLYALLAGRPAAVAEGLRSAAGRVRLLAVRRAAADGDAQVLPALVELLTSCRDQELLAEIIRALGSFQEPSLTGRLLPFLTHDDAVVAAWTMNSLVQLNSPAGRAALQELVTVSAEQVANSGICDLRTAQAIGSIGKYRDAAAAEFLVTYIHHTVAAFRRVVISELAAMGEVVLPAMARCLTAGDKDEKIMAANIVGWTGHKKGADLLITVLDQDAALDANLRFAIYEGLGRIASMRSFIGLADGLQETDEMVLMAVVTGLNELCNPGLVKTIKALLDQADEQSKRVLQAMVTSRAARLFAAVHAEGSHRQTLLEAITASGDHEAIAFFRAELAKMASAEAQADAEKLVVGARVSGQRKIVAADDSKAMLFFYKGAAVELGLELTTAVDGKEALEFMQTASDIELLVTDMNMPNMDGIELTRELRKLPQWAGLPILMATTETEAAQADQARAAGVNDFLSKPFSKEDFIKKISEFLKSA